MPRRHARTVAALLAAIPLALAACGGNDDTVAAPQVPAGEAPASDSPEPGLSPAGSPSAEVPASGSADASPSADEASRTGNVPVDDLEVGDCFDDVAGALNEVDEVPVVPCDEPHANEVFAVLQQPGDAYPGEEDVRGLADEGCSASFEEYVGAPLETSSLTPFPITPTAESWAQGDRQVVCVLTSAGPRTSPARGSGA